MRLRSVEFGDYVNIFYHSQRYLFKKVVLNWLFCGIRPDRLDFDPHRHKWVLCARKTVTILLEHNWWPMFFNSPGGGVHVLANRCMEYVLVDTCLKWWNVQEPSRFLLSFITAIKKMFLYFLLKFIFQKHIVMLPRNTKAVLKSFLCWKTERYCFNSDC